MDSPRAANATLTRVGACSWPNASWTTVGRCAAPRSASRPPCRRRPGGQPVPGAGGGQQSARGDDRPIESAAAQPDPGAPPGGAPSRPGAGHRVLGRERGTPNSRAASAARAGSRPVTGYGYVHTALDDHSRLAYSEVLADETAATTVAWWQRAIAWFAGHGIRIERVPTTPPATAPAPGSTPAAGTRSPPSAPGPTGPRPTTRSSATTAPFWSSGPTPASTPPTPPAPRRCANGCTSTTITGPTPRSAASRRRAASPTSQVRTPSTRERKPP